MLPLLFLVTWAGLTTDLGGAVTFNGAHSPTRQLAVGADPLCSIHQVQGTVSQGALRVADGGGVAHAFVYLMGDDLSPAHPPGEPAEVTIKGCQIRPGMIGLRAGQKLRIRNEDPTHHGLLLGNELSRGIRSKTTEEIEVKTGGIGIPLRSARHSWSRGYLHVMDHDYFTITDAEGRYELTGVHPGKYEIIAWHPVLGSLKHPIDVSDETTKTVSFTFLKIP